MGLLLFIGGVIGFLVGLLLGMLSLLAASFLLPSFGILGSLLAPAIALIAPLLGPLSLPSGLALWGLSVFVVTAIAYALAAVGLLPIVPAFGPSGPQPPVALEMAMRGFIIGLTTSVNFLVWAVLLGNPVIATLLALINFLAVVPGVSGSRRIYQPILGFASWLLPTTYLMMPLGILLFILNLPSALSTPFGIRALRFDFLTATIEMTGGTVLRALVASGPGRGTTGGFNLGNFTFLMLAPGASPATVQTTFGLGGLSDHETGHTLSVAALGGFHAWINAIDQNIRPLRRLTRAYGELVANSHFGGILGQPSVTVW